METIAKATKGILSFSQKNEVLHKMATIIEGCRAELIEINRIECQNFDEADRALYDRLKVNDVKIDDMIEAVNTVAAKPDPIGKELYSFEHNNGMQVRNVTAPFGTVLIIYESRPDVTIEAAAIAFKSGNKILLKGGKEARSSNLKLVECWHKALAASGLSTDWIEYLDLQRRETQAFLIKPNQPLNLIVPRGGDKLIEFVKTHAKCPVLVSGRGNNFLYVHELADVEIAKAIIINAKLTKISACNALDKVLIDENLPNKIQFIDDVIDALRADQTVEVFVDESTTTNKEVSLIKEEQLWYTEFLDYKIAFGLVADENEAIGKINKYSGGHSASIITQNDEIAKHFMINVDSAAVYHNASTRFTDGGAFGMGAELAISTEKMHHRGPLGLEQLVSNKWYIKGNGQIR